MSKNIGFDTPHDTNITYEISANLAPKMAGMGVARRSLGTPSTGLCHLFTKIAGITYSKFKKTFTSHQSSNKRQN